MSRTYLYKLTSDRGGAPCAIEPEPGELPLLTLAICKPAIRRTAQPGDRILGITSRALHQSEGYPLGAVIYAAVVGQNLPARDYFAPETIFGNRPDCIYEFHRQLGEAVHRRLSRLHISEEHIARDLGRYPLYRNGHVLLASDFRYFGSSAVPIPDRLPLLAHAAAALGQGHRVFESASPETREVNALFRLLWKKPTRYTPRQVGPDAYEHGGRRQPPPCPSLCGSSTSSSRRHPERRRSTRC